MRTTKTLNFRFSQKHIDYIRKCRAATINVAEGAVRAGKTIDNVFAFADELERSPDIFHLASGATSANAKLNIGVANGYGLEAMFRGRCRWTKYQGNEALQIRTPTGTKYVVFAGGGKADSFKKIRGNSYGLWIATEINLHHADFIREAFNRQLAAGRRKVYWDLNPEHPKAPIYTDYLDVYDRREAAGEFPYPGYYNYEHFTIFDNETVSPERLKEILVEYQEGSIWYIRDILGQRTIAEGLIYPKLAESIAARDQRFFIPAAEAMRMTKKQTPGDYVSAEKIRDTIIEINIGIDFGGNGSGHAFVASGMTEGYQKLIVLRSKRYVEGERDPDTGRRLNDIDPEILSALFLRFLTGVIADYGFVTKVYADSAEPVLIRGIRNAMNRRNLGSIKVENARKSEIIGRIRAVTTLAAQGRIFYTEECETFTQAISMAVWNPKKIELERLDDGTSDIDTLDAFEYSFERRIRKLLSGAVWEGSGNGDNRLD